MGRNLQKVYYTPSFEPSTGVYQKLIEDAQRNGKTMAELIVLRLGDYYKGKQAELAALPVIASPSNITKNALAAAAAWGDDDDDSPTQPQLTAIRIG